MINAESDATPDCSCIVRRAASSAALKLTEQRNVIASTLGGLPDFLLSCFIGWIFSGMVGNCQPQVCYGDYDFGVIATLSIARVLCSKSDFMLHKT